MLDPSLSFLPEFERRFAARLGRRREGGFRAICLAAERFFASSGKPLLVVETGGLRKLNNWRGDGQSTRVFDAFVEFHGGYLLSVDRNPACAVLTRRACGSHAIAVTADSCCFLRALPGKSAISVLYLDSFDLDLNDPGPSSRHHAEELTAVLDGLSPGTVIGVDDNLVVEGREIGKGTEVARLLHRRDVPLIHNGYQKVWQLSYE